MLYEKLDYVLAIAEEQNLTRAAEKLYISQPTLTMYLNRLEESLGVKLFDRRKSPVLLTAAGKHYIEKMKEIAEAEQILRGELHTVQDPAKTLRIGAARVRGHYWLPLLLKGLLERHPEINIVVSLGSERQLQRLLEKGSLDLAIGSLADIPESNVPLVLRDVANEKLLLVAHRQYGLVPADERGNNSPHEPFLLEPSRLQRLPFIAPPPANGMYQSFQKMIGGCNIQPSRTIVVDTMTTGLMMVEQGLGVQLISAGILVAIPSEERRRELDYCVLPDFPEAKKCCVSWREDTEQLPLILETVDVLKKDVLPSQIFTDIIE